MRFYIHTTQFVVRNLRNLFNKAFLFLLYHILVKNVKLDISSIKSQLYFIS